MIVLVQTSPFEDSYRRLLKNTPVTIYLAGTNILAALWADSGGAIAAPNPTTTDDVGNLVEVYAEEGLLDLSVNDIRERIQVSGSVTTHSGEVSGIHGVGVSTVESSDGAQTKADLARDAAKAYADVAVAGLVGLAPAALDTLNELATALGNDPNFATTVNNAIAARATQVALDAEAAARIAADDLRALLTHPGLSDERVPLDLSVTGAKVVAALKNPAAGVAGLRTLGVEENQAAAGNRIWPGQIIGSTRYAPGLTFVTLMTTSLTPVDVDANNLSVSFVVPPSGAVVVTLSARAIANGEGVWTLREGNVVVPLSTSGYIQHTTLHGRVVHIAHVSGLTPGEAKIWKWAHHVHTGSSPSVTIYVGPQANVGQAYMEVRAG